MSILMALLFATLFLAYSNGANDNCKGVATLCGSKVVSYKLAIAWATMATFMGSVFSIVLSERLLKSFSGKNLVPPDIAGSPEFLLSVALAAALTVIFATFIGIPISTTHSLIGALVGSGVAAIGWKINFLVLGKKFFLPLIVSPMAAVCISFVCYILFRGIRKRLGVKKEFCLCVGGSKELIPLVSSPLSMKSTLLPTVSLANQQECEERYVGKFFGLKIHALLDCIHFFSAGIVSFARGLNDTPKIVALLLVFKSLEITHGMLIVSIAIALGGIINAKKVAETMSHKIIRLNSGQGLVANLVTGFLVIFASRWGLPVSTTHASCGSIFGIGLATQKGNSNIISQIIFSWVLTLPIAALLGFFVYCLL